MLPPKVVVAPVDFSEHSQTAALVAADLASRFGSQLLLVHAVPALPKLPPDVSIFHEAEYEDELRKDAERRLRTLANELSRTGITVQIDVGVANDVGMEILRMAERNQGELIVIATHGMTGWRRLAFGSIAEKVVRLATCPVLVLRAKATAGGELADDESPSARAGLGAAAD